MPKKLKSPFNLNTLRISSEDKCTNHCIGETSPFVEKYH